MANVPDEAVESLAYASHKDGELAPLTKDTPFKRAFGRKECGRQLCSLLNAMLCTGVGSPLAIADILNVESKDTNLRSVIFVSVRNTCRPLVPTAC